MKSIKNILYLLAIGIAFVGNTYAKRACIINKLDHPITVSGSLEVKSYHERNIDKAKVKAAEPFQVKINPSDRKCYNNVDSLEDIQVLDEHSNPVEVSIEPQNPNEKAILYVISKK